MGPKNAHLWHSPSFTTGMHHVYDRLYISILVFMASLGVNPPRGYATRETNVARHR